MILSLLRRHYTEVENQGKGYELMIKREENNLDAATEKLAKLNANKKEVETAYGEAKAEAIEAKRAAEKRQGSPPQRTPAGPLIGH